MNVHEVLADAKRLAGTVQTVEGVLMENTKQPFLGDSPDDWASGKCVHLKHDGLFDLLLETLFPNIIGGGRTLFLYPAVVVGQVEWNPTDGVCSLSGLRSIRVDVHGEQFVLNLV